jgi:transcriptional regulator with XRE-family HTH domain
MLENTRSAPVTKKHHVLRPDADLQTRIGAVVRACRKHLGISQEELAWRTDMHRTYISDLERGSRNLTLRSIASVAKGLQITIGNLFAHVTAPSGTVPPAGTEPSSKEVREIMLVEHDAQAAEATALAFKRAKLANPLRIVGDGETALHYLFGTGRYAKRKPARPQLILLVPDLPGMPGEEFMSRVKGDRRTSDIPFVILSVSH